MSMPASRSVGTSGKRLARSSLQVTSRRTLPSSTSCAQPELSAIASIWPPSVACMLSAKPRKGTCVQSILVLERGGEPLGRQALPHLDLPALVERVDDHDEDRREEQRVDERAVAAQERVA